MSISRNEIIFWFYEFWTLTIYMECKQTTSLVAIYMYISKNYINTRFFEFNMHITWNDIFQTDWPQYSVYTSHTLEGTHLGQDKTITGRLHDW